MFHESLHELAHVHPRVGQSRDEPERARDVPLQDEHGGLEQRVGVHLTEQSLDVLEADRPATEGGELLERADRVAHAAERMLRDERERAVRDAHGLGIADVAQSADDVLHRQPTEVEALAAGVDRLGHLVGVRGAHDEHGARRRLFERLEQRVERRGGEHVHLVDDVDLVATARRRVVQTADDLLAHVVHTGA